MESPSIEITHCYVCFSIVRAATERGSSDGRALCCRNSESPRVYLREVTAARSDRRGSLALAVLGLMAKY
jgi:hypothetical protein